MVKLNGGSAGASPSLVASRGAVSSIDGDRRFCDDLFRHAHSPHSRR
jgi:hypothetical protein